MKSEKKDLETKLIELSVHDSFLGNGMTTIRKYLDFYKKAYTNNRPKDVKFYNAISEYVQNFEKEYNETINPQNVDTKEIDDLLNNKDVQKYDDEFVDFDDDLGNGNDSDELVRKITKLKSLIKSMNNNRDHLKLTLEDINNDCYTLNKFGNDKHVSVGALTNYVNYIHESLNNILTNIDNNMSKMMKNTDIIERRTIKFSILYNAMRRTASLKEKHLLELAEGIKSKEDNVFLTSTDASYLLSRAFMNISKLGQLIDPDFKIDLPNISMVDSISNALNYSIVSYLPEPKSKVEEVEKEKELTNSTFESSIDRIIKDNSLVQHDPNLTEKENNKAFNSIRIKLRSDAMYASRDLLAEDESYRKAVMQLQSVQREMVDFSMKLDIKEERIKTIISQNELLSKMFDEDINVARYALDKFGNMFADKVRTVKPHDDDKKFVLSLLKGINEIQKLIIDKLGSLGYNTILDILSGNPNLKPGLFMSIMYIIINHNKCPVENIVEHLPSKLSHVRSMTIPTVLNSIIRRYIGNITSAINMGENSIAQIMSVGLIYVTMNTNVIASSKGTTLTIDDIENGNVLTFNSPSLMNEIFPTETVNILNAIENQRSTNNNFINCESIKTRFSILYDEPKQLIITNQSTKRSTNQSTKRSTDQSTNQSTKRSTNQSIKRFRLMYSRQQKK